MIKNKYVKIAVVLIIILVIVSIFVYKKFIYTENDNIDIKEEQNIPRIYTFINFVAPGCKPCENMEVLMEELIKEYDGVVEIKQLDVYENIRLANAYGITSTPTQIFLDIDGNLVAKNVGFLGKSTIKQVLSMSGVELK